MKKKSVALLFGIIVFGCIYYFYYQHQKKNIVDLNRIETIHIGWQTAWATQGQVIQALKHTNILKLNKLKAEYTGVTYGPDLNIAILGGAPLDVIFTADQPAAALLSKVDTNWTIVARLMYNRVSIYVPPHSNINSVKELKGKTLMIPFGAAAHRDALMAIEKAGLDPKKDVNIKNLGISEQASLVSKRTENSYWGNSVKIDALSGFDPTPAVFESKGLAKMIHIGNVVSVLVMSTKLLKNNPVKARHFLKAFIEAWDYYSKNQGQCNNWFINDSHLEFDSKVLQIAAKVEPNINAQNILDIRPTFTLKDLEVMQEASDFIYKQKLVGKRVVMKKHVNTTVVKSIMEEFKSNGYDEKNIKPNK